MSSRSSDVKVELQPVGWVRNQGEEKPADGVWEELVSEIEIDEAVAPALKGLEEFSHIIVLFWIDRRDPSDRPLQVHPQGREDLPLKGVFATRSPFRPNLIAMTLCKIVSVKDNVVEVEKIDAFDGTPILDIKPFDNWDLVEKAKVPDWWTKLEEERSQRRSS